MEQSILLWNSKRQYMIMFSFVYNEMCCSTREYTYMVRAHPSVHVIETIT